MGRPSIRQTSTAKLVLLVPLVVGLLVWLVGSTIEGATDQYRLADWPSTEGTVTRSEWRWRRLFSRRLVFACTFEVEGREYEIEKPRRLDGAIRYWFGGVGRFVEAHPPDSTMTVWYDPADPTRATTGQGLSIVDVIPYGAMGVVLLATACLMVVELVGRGYGRAVPGSC